MLAEKPRCPAYRVREKVAFFLHTCSEGVLTTATDPRAIPVSERLLRREAVENAIADLRLEGLAPTDDARLLFEHFVQGDLTEDQLVSAVLAL
jgi:hypothetical protein